jgi:hypothetical protein
MTYQYIDTTGVILSDTSTVQAEVVSEWQTALGADLITTPDTPQGVLIAQETQARANVINNNAAVANQLNPNVAGGVFLDAICAWLGLYRTPASFTQVNNVTLNGVLNTIIPAGVQASTAAGDIFVLQSSVTIPVSGSISGNFLALQSGAVPCAIGALTNIEPSTAVLGWESITNPTAGILGNVTQSDAELRTLRLNTLALQGMNSALSTSSNLINTTGVTSSAFLENYYNVPMGMLIGITGGTTLSGDVFGLTTTGNITVDTTSLAFAKSLQSVPAAAINPWPTAAYGTTGNVSLTGLGTQSGGDWGINLTDGQIVLCSNQTTASQNGLWLAHSGSWTRHAYMASGTALIGSNEGISMIRNSVWSCVAGGTNLAVATALLNSKSQGAGWNGGVSQSVVESASGQSYNVLFDRPTAVNIAVIVTLSQGTNTSNLTQTVLQAMIDFTNGKISGESDWVVGANASPFDLAGAIVNEQPGVKVREIQIATLPGLSYGNLEIEIAQNQQAVLDLSYITINVI